MGQLRPTVLQVSHEFLEEALSSTATKDAANNTSLVGDGVRDTSGEEILAVIVRCEWGQMEGTY